MQSVKLRGEKQLSIIFTLDGITQFNKKVIILLSCLFKASLFIIFPHIYTYFCKNHIQHKKKQKIITLFIDFFLRYII